MIENILKIKKDIDYELSALANEKNMEIYQHFFEIKQSVAILTETYTPDYLKKLDDEKLKLVTKEGNSILDELKKLSLES